MIKIPQHPYDPYPYEGPMLSGRGGSKRKRDLDGKSRERAVILAKMMLEWAETFHGVVTRAIDAERPGLLLRDTELDRMQVWLNNHLGALAVDCARHALAASRDDMSDVDVALPDFEVLTAAGPASLRSAAGIRQLSLNSASKTARADAVRQAALTAPLSSGNGGEL